MTQINEEKLLEELGLEAREVKIYLALLDKGALLPQQLAMVTSIKRATIYTIFPEMVKKGYLTEVTKGKRRFLTAVSPDKLYASYESKTRDIKENFDQLIKIYRLQGLKPKIDYFEGFEGVKEVYWDTINQSKSSHEILLFDQVSDYNPKVMGWILNDYIPERLKKKVSVRALAPREKESRDYLGEKRNEMRETKYVPKEKFPFRIEGMIYKDKVSFVTIEKGGPLVGIVIQSVQIADTLRALFNLAWEGADKYSK